MFDGLARSAVLWVRAQMANETSLRYCGSVVALPDLPTQRVRSSQEEIISAGLSIYQGDLVSLRETNKNRQFATIYWLLVQSCVSCGEQEVVDVAVILHSCQFFLQLFQCLRHFLLERV